MKNINKQNNMLVSKTHDTKREELWKILNEARFPHDRKEYNGSFDDGNHPGENTEHIATKNKEEEQSEVIFYINEKETDKNIFNRVQENILLLPIKKIQENAQQKKTTTVILKQEGAGKRGVWNVLGKEIYQVPELWEIVHRWSIDKNFTWKSTSYITFIPTETEPLTLSIKANMITIPATIWWNKPLLWSSGIYQRDISEKEVNEALKSVA